MELYSVHVLSCEAVLNRPQIRSGSRQPWAPPNPSLHGGWSTACGPAAGAAPHPKGCELPSFIHDTVSLRILPTFCLPPSSMGQPAAARRQQYPSLVVSHDDSCSPSRRAGSADTNTPASIGVHHHQRSLSCSAAPCSHPAKGHDRVNTFLLLTSRKVLLTSQTFCPVGAQID